MMSKTSTEGTASLLGVDAAVKTGTAEYIVDGEIRTHAWITGFTPREEPEYTITVFVEDGGSGAQTAGPILKEIIEYLQKSGNYNKPTLA
jgi:cell division protein FtsI/penicillin-binding protein 2